MSTRFKHSPEHPQRPTARVKPARGDASADAPLMTLREWCQLHGFSQNTARKFVEDGMPCIRADRHIRIEPERALEWLRAKTVKDHGTGTAS